MIRNSASYFFLLGLPFAVTATPYPIVDTGQVLCYGNDSTSITCPAQGASFYGQDAQYSKNSPSYTKNNDGTVTDNVTGLMWPISPDLNGDGKIDASDMRSFDKAKSEASMFSLAGYTDWRLPTIKELYSLMNFSGASGTASPSSTSVPADAIPYIDTDYFDFEYGDTASGLRYIDAQYWSSTEYVSTTMAGIQSAAGDATAFGVNFADGRIKGYGTTYNVINDGRYVRYVRGGNNYGINSFVDNGNNTISDTATQLMWMQQDSGHLKAGSQGNGGVNWQEALAWCENLSYANYNDWRLPNAKELQSIVDYTHSPDTTTSAAIDPLFSVTTITDEASKTNYPFYWSSTTHNDGPDFAVYIAFGEALGCMAPLGSSTKIVTDVHGAGAQRSDPKTANSTIGCGNGPQGDVIRVYNHARCVRDIVLADQTITFDTLSDKVLGDAPFTVSATGGASGNPVTFTATGNCTIDITTVTLTAVGTCTITASQAGNADYQAAVDVSHTFNILAAVTTPDPNTLPTTTDPVVTDPVPPATDPGATDTTSPLVDPSTTPTSDTTTQPEQPPVVPSTPTTGAPTVETPTAPPPTVSDTSVPAEQTTTTVEDSATGTTSDPRFQLADKPPLAVELSCPTDKHAHTQLNEGCNADGRTIENLKIGRGGSLANAVITGTITSDRGWISNVTFETSAVLDGGYVTSSIINKGLMKNFEFRGQRIQGGTLGGTVVLSSRVGNEIREVMLAPGTVIRGKIGEGFVKTKLVGTIKGDATDPATLENVTIVAGTQLDNVILGQGVFLEEGIIFGENVKSSDGEAILPTPGENETPVTTTCDAPNALGINAKGEEVNDAQTCFKIEPDKQQVKISIQIDPTHIGQEANLLLVIRASATKWHSFDKTQWQEWDGNLNNLKVKEVFPALPQVLELEIALSEFHELGHSLTLFVGYQLQDGFIVYNTGQSL